MRSRMISGVSAPRFYQLYTPVMILHLLALRFANHCDCLLIPELTRQHREAAQAAKRPPTHPTPEAHETQVRQLEAKQYSLGKALNEEQASVAKREAELGQVKLEREEIKGKDIGEDDWVDGKA